MMIARVWHGWTTHANADAFELVMKSEIYPRLLGKQVAGFRGTQLLRLARAGQTEFINLSWFDDMDAVRCLVGDDYDKPMLTAKARALLRRSDEKSEHYAIREEYRPRPD